MHLEPRSTNSFPNRQSTEVCNQLKAPSLFEIDSALRDLSSVRHVHKIAYITSSVLGDALSPEVPLITCGLKLSSETLRPYYLSKDGVTAPPRVDIIVAKDPLASMINPRDFTRIKATFEHVIDSSTTALFRFRIVEHGAAANNRVFGLTGSHIVCGLLDARRSDTVKLYYYCPMGAPCPVFIENLLPESSRSIELYNNYRTDQNRDGYCALFCHSMLLMFNSSARPGGIPLRSFPSNDSESMFSRVSRNLHQAMHINPGLVKEFYS